MLKSAIVTGLGGLLFGFDRAVICRTEETLQKLKYESIVRISGLCIAGQFTWILTIMPESKSVFLEKIPQQHRIEQ